jgi:hypothetical protein
MTEHYVHVYATKEVPYPPYLEDDEGHIGTNEQQDKDLTTKVYDNDTITWSIFPSEKDGIPNAIASIDNITIDSNDFLASGPTRNDDGTWTAEVGEVEDPSMYGDGYLKYTIYYTVDGTPQKHQDPKLRFRPTIGS